MYGTLKKGGYFGTEFDHIRKSNRIAKLKGFNLYSLGPFPTISPGDGEVVGELHDYDEEYYEYVLNRTDRIEGFDGSEHSLYIRREVEVETEDGQKELAYTYVMDKERVASLNVRKIANGIWKI